MNMTVNEKIKESISDFQPDLIGITCLFTMSHQSFKEVAEYLSTIFCGPIIAGGVHVTNDAERVLDDVPQLDAIILREAEVALKHFLLNVNEEDKPENLNQIIFKEENKYYEISNSFSSPTVEDFDIHPEMKLMEVNELSRYGCVGAYRYLVENSKITTLLSNKGCRGKCTFCCVSTFNGKGVRKRNVKSVVDEIEKLHKYQDNLARKIPSIDDTDELWDKLLPKVEELVKETIREAEVDIDAYVEINSASLRV